MAVMGKIKHIAVELKGHWPFTLFGAVMGIGFMLAFRKLGLGRAEVMFDIFHPAHVVLSAMVTASMFALHRERKSFLFVLVIGYVGSVGVATLSDSVIPYIGEHLLGLNVPRHADMHTGGDEGAEEYKLHEKSEEPEHTQCEHKLHLGFIENWYIVNPAAVLGVLIAYFLPRTKFPHAGHVLISTWASSSHIMMNTAGDITAPIAAGVFVILFIAVWLPCCVSDIVFPLMFVKSDLELVNVCACKDHARHSHEHIHVHSEKCEHGKDDSDNTAAKC